MVNSTEERLSLRETAALLFAAPFLAVGWLVGFTKRSARLAWAAVIEGYNIGSKLL